MSVYGMKSTLKRPLKMIYALENGQQADCQSLSEQLSQMFYLIEILDERSLCFKVCVVAVVILTHVHSVELNAN